MRPGKAWVMPVYAPYSGQNNLQGGKYIFIIDGKEQGNIC